VPKKLFKSPLELVKEWPEVFEDMYMNTMPVDYLHSLRLEFSNGRIWEIDIQERLTDSTPDSLADKILEIFQEYREDITKIGFSINVDKLKKDIENQTKDLL
jgi:hypothetical protein